MELGLSLSQKQILSQQLIQSLQVLQMSAQELESYLERLSMENPVVELPEKETHTDQADQLELQRKLDWLSNTDQQNRVYYQGDRDEDDPENNWQDLRASEETLEDYLNAQLLMKKFSASEEAVIKCIINALDHRGYFTDSLQEIAALYGETEETAERLLKEVQDLDPAGVGARDLKECLLLQLKRKPDYSAVTERIISEELDTVAKNHLPELAKRLGIDMNELQTCLKEIRTLDPKPGSSFSNRDLMRYISPDAVVIALEDRFEILINEFQYPPITISKTYEELEKSTEDKAAKKYLREKIAEAKNVAQSIRQRSSTLSLVLHVIVEAQKDFFLYGPGHKHPLRLSEISEAVELSDSTVSRALSSKFLQCRYGIFPLNYFLTTAAISSDTGEEKTAEDIKTALREIIDTENKKKPLSDNAIALALEKKGLAISRRTVNKYRTEMGIPDKSGRKNWG